MVVYHRGLAGLRAHQKNLKELTGKMREIYIKLYDEAVEKQRERNGR